MRIMFLNQAARHTDDEYHEHVEPLLRGYASPGTQVDLCYPDDDYERARVQDPAPSAKHWAPRR